MNRVWIARAIGLLILLAFVLLMMHLQSRLMELQQTPPAQTSTSR